MWLVLVEVDGDSLVEVAEHFELRSDDVAGPKQAFQISRAVDVDALAVHPHPEPRSSRRAFVIFAEFFGLLDDLLDFGFGEVSLTFLVFESDSVGWCRCHFLLGLLLATSEQSPKNWNRSTK